MASTATALPTTEVLTASLYRLSSRFADVPELEALVAILGRRLIARWRRLVDDEIVGNDVAVTDSESVEGTLIATVSLMFEGRWVATCLLPHGGERHVEISLDGRDLS